MKNIKYKNLKISNFLSVGHDVVEIDFQKGLNQIDGINSDIPDRKNGVGKCLDEFTEVDILIEDTMVLERFKKFHNID